MHQEKQEAQDGRILIYDDYNIRVSSQPKCIWRKICIKTTKKECRC